MYQKCYFCDSFENPLTPISLASRYLVEPCSRESGHRQVRFNTHFHMHWATYHLTVRIAAYRVHRIGQTKDVEVHRILVKDTIEDKIVELQNKKQVSITKKRDNVTNGILC